MKKNKTYKAKIKIIYYTIFTLLFILHLSLFYFNKQTIAIIVYLVGSIFIIYYMPYLYIMAVKYYSKLFKINLFKTKDFHKITVNCLKNVLKFYAIVGIFYLTFNILANIYNFYPYASVSIQEAFMLTFVCAIGLALGVFMHEFHYMQARIFILGDIW